MSKTAYRKLLQLEADLQDIQATNVALLRQQVHPGFGLHDLTWVSLVDGAKLKFSPFVTGVAGGVRPRLYAWWPGYPASEPIFDVGVIVNDGLNPAMDGVKRLVEEWLALRG